MLAPRATWPAQPVGPDRFHAAKPAPATDSTNFLREIGAPRAFPLDTSSDTHVLALHHGSVARQKAADSELEARNAAACRVKDSGYWNREPCPASGYVSRTAFGRFSPSR